MNGVFKNRKFWLVAVAVAVACGLFAGNYSLSQEEKENRGDHEVKLISSATLTQYPAGIAIAIQRIFVRNNLTEKDLYKVGFSSPEEPSFGDKPEFEIFSPKGGQMTPFNPEYYTDAGENPVFLYTLGNKVKGAMTEKTDFLAIFPHPFYEICKQVNRESLKDNTNEVSIPKVDRDPNLLKFPQEPIGAEIVELPEGVKSTFGCVEAPSGLYFYQVLLPR